MATEFISALEELTTARGVPLEDVLRTVEQALAAAYRRAFDPAAEITVRLDPATAEIRVTGRRVLEDGREEVQELPTDEFIRMAAQTAKAAVLRHLRDLERESVMEEVSQRRGELAAGVVDRSEGGSWVIDLGRVEGLMPAEEQIPGEVLRVGRPVTVVILDAYRRGHSAQVRVSRASQVFVHRLLETEVPEIGKGVVQVRAIAREAGLRTKIAVSTEQVGIDPVGACVGPRGVRHRSLLSELGSEHIDIVPWSEDPERFVAAALGPARVVGVRIDRDTRTANVLVPSGQLSLAIGKDGQNARLAARLTGWRIDIKAAPQEAVPETVPEPVPETPREAPHEGPYEATGPRPQDARAAATRGPSREGPPDLG
ncbi:MAG: transcription termination factor NusA [Candidatus Dormibacterales bacterium]